SPSPSPSPSGTAPSGTPDGTEGGATPSSPGGTPAPGERTLPEDEVPAPDGVAPGELDGTAPEGGDEDTDEHADDDHAHGSVTLETVVGAATRLAELLGSDRVPVGVV